MKVSPTLGTTEKLPRKGYRRAVAALTAALLALSSAVVLVTPAHATAAALSGYVTGADTHLGIATVQVEIFNTTTYQNQWTQTDANGYYEFSTVPATGNYTLYFNARYALGGYANQYYPGSNYFSGASTLALSNSTPVVKSVEIVRGGQITGHITFSASPHSVQIDVSGYNPVTAMWEGVGAVTTNGDGDWACANLLADFYKVSFTDTDPTPYYAHEYYNDVIDQEDAHLVLVTSGGVTNHIDAELTPSGPSNVVRYAGSDRFKTSARIAEAFSSVSVVFVANGMGYPDALSAAPAAAHLNAPLLLTQQNSLPAEVKAQIVRLHPATIYVVGGIGVISQAVFDELAPLATEIHRLAGADRYATSRAVFTGAWEGDDAVTAFLADGRNYPDALASASAAAKTDGPVILVNGGASAVPSDFGSLLSPFNTAHLALAGGTSVLSTGIETSAEALAGIDAQRYFGSNRYGTSWTINNHFFSNANSVYLATGSGYADALAGAALAGGTNAPLYLIPSNCIPQNVLDAIHNLGATRIVLFGGTGVLSSAVESLASCNPPL